MANRGFRFTMRPNSPYYRGDRRAQTFLHRSV
jgi:hypothetical protein